MKINVSLVAVAAVAILLPRAFTPAHLEAAPPIPAGAALAGTVGSAEEPNMGGVLVNAKKDGTNITLTVVSDEQGRYAFPASRLEPGHYTLSVRAGGYDLQGPAAVDVDGQKPAAADLKLQKTRNLAGQLTNAEWLASFPGTEQQKASVRFCTHCHTLERVARSSHDSEEFMQVIDRMFHYTPESFPLMVQPPAAERIGGGELNEGQLQQREETRRKQAEYLATLNLSSASQWSYQLKTFPRPSGRAARVLITQYDLPKRTNQPHDVIVDSQGMVWWASFGEPILAKMDPKTGKMTQYPIPVLKKNTVFGILDLEFDKDENVWMAMTFQAAVAKFDRKTETFQVYKLPPDMDADYREITFADPTHSDVDGKVWINDSGSYTVLRLDIKTGKFEVFEPFKIPRPNVYQVLSDKENNGWFNVMGREDIGRVDAKTGKISIFATPTPHSAPRRGSLDAQGRIWFAENRGNKIGMFDPRTEKFQEWATPPGYFPYDVVTDKNGEAWAVSEFTDQVLRLNPKTGEMVAYLLPRETNMRRAWVDNSTTPVTFWVGNNHGASIVKLEPLD